MITQPSITIQNNAEFYDDLHFKIQMIVPGEILATISAAIKLGDEPHFSSIDALGCIIEVSDYEFAGDEVLWADFYIDHAPVSFMRNDDGSYLMSMIFEKEPEGDEYLDQLAYERSMSGKLPENFWITPAKLIRKLISATKH